MNKKLGNVPEVDGLQANQAVGRVIIEHNQLYRVLTKECDYMATLTGQFYYQTEEKSDYPAVGDWVIIEETDKQKAKIVNVMPRTSTFSRKTAGLKTEEQIIATNIDYVFIVTSMNEDFNLNRLERYMIAVAKSGAKPVVVLTKADLSHHHSFYTQQLDGFSDLQYVVVSALHQEGVAPLQLFFKGGKTGVFVGSSGVGKSTLINGLLQRYAMQVNQISKKHQKGKHTTTHRELHVLKEGYIIDTPGMREFQLWEQVETLDDRFNDIQFLALQCRFRDCAHRHEKGCAVQFALESGSLSSQRLAHYFKLLRELEGFEKRKKQQERVRNKKRNKKKASRYK